MYTPVERDHLRAGLLLHAEKDPRITAAAITGSAATAHEDQWSDIDLAFAVGNPAEVPDVLDGWTDYMYREHHALHHFDVHAGAWIYRVFLLLSTLQVDLAFVPAAEFRALAPSFRLVFGAANPAHHTADSPPKDMIGLGWLYALHARSCIARRKFWQAEYMISGIRDTALALACLRHSLPAVHGRGMDLLPGKVAAPFEEALVRHLDAPELSRAFRAVTHLILNEIQSVDRELAERLQPALVRMAGTSRE